MAERTRAKISITVDPETLSEVDKIAERFGENRSRVLERLVADGVWQHRHVAAGGTGTLPEIREVYRRVFIYSDHYEMGGIGIRTKAYDVRWDDLPPELQEFFPPNIKFSEWSSTAEMLKDERASLEHALESIKQRLGELKGAGKKGK